MREIVRGSAWLCAAMAALAAMASPAAAGLEITLSADGEVSDVSFGDANCGETCTFSPAGPSAYRADYGIAGQDFWFDRPRIRVRWANGMATDIPLRLHAASGDIDIPLEMPSPLTSCRARSGRDEPLVTGGPIERVLARMSEIRDILDRDICGSDNTRAMRLYYLRNALRLSEQRLDGTFRMLADAINRYEAVQDDVALSHRLNEIGDDVDAVLNYVSSRDGMGDVPGQCAVLKALRSTLVQIGHLGLRPGVDDSVSVYCGPRWRTQPADSEHAIGIFLRQ